MRKTILVVEDERPLLEVVQVKLEGSGFDIVTARSVGQALQFLREIKNIDAIWLDHYLLGKQNGVEFVSELKKNEDMQKIPVFVVSNSASENTKQAYLSLGVERYYVKSDFDLAQIIDDMRLALNM